MTTQTKGHSGTLADALETALSTAKMVSDVSPLDDFYNDEPRGQGWMVQIPPNSHLPSGTARNHRATGGRGSGELARTKALMEAAERLCLSTVDTATLTNAVAADLSNAIRPADLPTPWATVPAWNQPMHWCEARRLSGVNSEAPSVLVPAQMVYCPFDEVNDEAMFWDPTSNGAAAGLTMEEAVERGSQEAFERHVMLTAHYQQLGGRELSWQDLDLGPSAIKLGWESRCLGLRLRVACLTEAPYAVVVCCATDDSGRFPALTMGSAAADTIADAAGKAIEEAVFARRQARDFLSQAVPPEPHALESIEERVAFWGQPGLAPRLGYLFDGEDLPLQAQLAATVLDAGLYVDVTLPILAELGVSVVKVIHPGLQPLVFSEDTNARLRASNALFTNGDPHPYA